MKNRLIAIILLTLSATLVRGQGDENEQILTPVTFNNVTLEDTFWKGRMEIQKQVLVPVAFERTQEAVEDLKIAAAHLRGDTTSMASPSRFNTSDLYKVIEGAAYLLTLERDARLERQIDEIAEIIAGAQEADGYLYPAHTTGSCRHADTWGGAGMGDAPYTWVVHSHELYNVGHLYEAAVAYYRATGKRNLLDIAEKSARHINRVFFEGDPRYNGGRPVNQAPGHQELELALVKLYQATGDEIYLEMASKFIDIRGVTYVPEGTGVMSPEYAQQHAPVRVQGKAVGHAVRAAYMYSAMADVGTLTGDPTLQPALHRIWDDIMDTKFHITGGLGAVHGIEGFGREYDLPNREAYDETCAAVGNVFFNHRMFLLEKDGKYMDVAEVSLLNNVLAGVNLGGDKFFYVNPLESDGMVDRSFWFGTACCPTNLARLIPQVSGLIYAHTDNEIYCSFYTSSRTEISLSGGTVTLVQMSGYPFDENVTLEVTPGNDGQRFAVKMRIPTWLGSQFLPGKLYSYTDMGTGIFTLTVNGEKVTAPVVEKGFVLIERAWKKGDTVELHLPMAVRLSRADERVTADLGRVAVTRGPLVYCAEGVDNEAGVNRYVVSPYPLPYASIRRGGGILKNIDLIDIPARYVNFNGKVEDKELTLLPYYAWNNRGVSTMNVWFAENENIVTEKGNLAAVAIKNVTSTDNSPQEKLLTIVSGRHPDSSSDSSFDPWIIPGSGETQAVEFELEKPSDVRSISVYWFRDSGTTRLPQSWSAEYMPADGLWRPFPIYSTDSYSTLADQFNIIHSDGNPISAEKIRLNITPRSGSAAGILQVSMDLHSPD